MNRANNFDAVRILAALAVVFGHAWPLSGGVAPTLAGNGVQTIAVKIFFVVSGFLVFKSWRADPDVRRYLLRRAMRLMPALCVLLIVTVLALGLFATTLPRTEFFAHAGTWRYVVSNLVLAPVYGLPGVFSQNAYPDAVNGSLWSLPVEALMYLVLPVVLVIAGRGVRGLFIAATTISVACLLHVAGPNAWIAWGTSSRAVADVAPYFFIGALCAAPAIERRLDPTLALLMIGVVALLQFPGALLQQLSLMLVLPFAVLSFATRTTQFACRAGRFGDPSYGIYLYAFPVQQTLFHLFPGMGAMANAGAAVPIVLLFAYASWHLVEKRILKHKPRAPARSVCAGVQPA